MGSSASSSRGSAASARASATPLLLAAGELPPDRPLRRVLLQADEREQQRHAVLALARNGAAQPQREADVLGGAERRDEREALNT